MAAKPDGMSGTRRPAVAESVDAASEHDTAAAPAEAATGATSDGSAGRTGDAKTGARAFSQSPARRAAAASEDSLSALLTMKAATAEAVAEASATAPAKVFNGAKQPPEQSARPTLGR